MKEKWKELGGALFILAVGFIAVIGTAILSNSFEKPTKVVLPEGAVRPIVVCPSDTESFKKIEKKATLIENKASNGTGGSLKGYKITLTRSGLTSDIACGYLIYKVSFGNKPIEQDSMALFMRPTDSQFGGHIWPDEKKGAIIDTIENKTQILLPLSVITHDGTAKQPIKEANWSSLLNVADQIEFEIALSADVPNGNLDLVQIAYKCVNKETGRETDQCELRVVKTIPFGF